ncbi:MAG: MFS transporter, partial [Bacteroidales bacterium]
AQGLFMIVTNGIGAFLGGMASGWVVDAFTDVSGMKSWPEIWFVFAGYALVIGILFAIFFKYKHKPEAIETTK